MRTDSKQNKINAINRLLIFRIPIQVRINTPIPKSEPPTRMMNAAQPDVFRQNTPHKKTTAVGGATTGNTSTIAWKMVVSLRPSAMVQATAIHIATKVATRPTHTKCRSETSPRQRL